MFDLFLTLALIYFGYRAYNWYARMQQQVGRGNADPDWVDSQREHRQNEDEYIDYEEVE